MIILTRYSHVSWYLFSSHSWCPFIGLLTSAETPWMAVKLQWALQCVYFEKLFTLLIVSGGCTEMPHACSAGWLFTYLLTQHLLLDSQLISFWTCTCPWLREFLFASIPPQLLLCESDVRCTLTFGSHLVHKNIRCNPCLALLMTLSYVRPSVQSCNRAVPKVVCNLSRRVCSLLQ